MKPTFAVHSSPIPARPWRRHYTRVLLTLFGLAMSAMNPVLAGKGGKGGGSETAPALIEAPVIYLITLIEWTEDVSNFALEDINREGCAVGWLRPVSSGQNQAIAANGSGQVWNLNDVYASSLQADFQGWRFNYISEINANGDFAGILVPADQVSSYSSTTHMLVSGNLDLDDIPLDPPLIKLDLFEDGTENGEFITICDLNEKGDLIVSIRVNGDSKHLVYYAPHTGPTPRVILEIPEYAIQANFGATLNSEGEVAHSVQVSKSKWNTLISNLNPSLPELNLGVFGRYPMISEAGALYDRPDGGPGLDNDYEIPRRWSPSTGEWELFSPPATLAAVSKAGIAEEVLLLPNLESPDPATPMVYKHGLGTYLIEVTGTPEDVASWNARATQGNWSVGSVSRPIASGFGYITGQFYSGDIGFILTPIPRP